MTGELPTGGSDPPQPSPLRRPGVTSLSPDSPPGRGAASGAPGAGELSILVVEDHHDTAESMALLFRLDGHRVRLALDGPQALTALIEEPPDVVTLDMCMPGMDGYEVARRIVEGRVHGSRTPVVIGVTGLQWQDRRAAEAGLELLLLKPAEPAELLALLRKLQGELARPRALGAGQVTSHPPPARARPCLSRRQDRLQANFSPGRPPALPGPGSCGRRS